MNIRCYIKILRYKFLKLFYSKLICIDSAESREYLEGKVSFENTISQKKTRHNDNKKDVSIIIPVFRNGKLLEECLKSVVYQKTDLDVEIILSLDGADTECKEVVSEFSKDSRIVVVENNINRGPASARNLALDIATGKYVLFVDSDDIIENGSIDLLYNLAESKHVDAVSGSYKAINSIGTVKEGKILSNYVSQKHEEGHRFNGYPWGNLINRRVFNDVSFPEGYYYEDTVMTYIVASLCESILHISDIVYYYRDNPSGICNTMKKGYRGIDSIWVTELCLIYLREKNMDINYRIFCQTLKQFSVILYKRVARLSNYEKKCIFTVCRTILFEYFKYDDFEVYEKPLNVIYGAFKTADYGVWKIASQNLD